jgi:hypothetical protein
MPDPPANQLLTESRVFDISPLGIVAEISFQGIHDWTHGNEMARHIQRIASENRPAAIIFNLINYQYVFGNDVMPLFVAALDQEAKKPRPVYIVATGRTHKSLYNLFKQTGALQKAIDVQFVESVEEAIRRLGVGRQCDPA